MFHWRSPFCGAAICILPNFSIVFHGVANPCSVCHSLESCFGNIPLCELLQFFFSLLICGVEILSNWLIRVLYVSMEKTTNMMPRLSCWTSTCMQWHNHLMSSLWWCHRSLFLSDGSWELWYTNSWSTSICSGAYCTINSNFIFNESSGPCGRYKHWLWRHS